MIDIEKKKVKWQSSDTFYICPRNIQFTFVSENGVQLYRFVTCKAYLQDFVITQFYGKLNHIDNPNQGDDKISLDRTNILITNSSDPDFVDNIEGCIDFLNQFEKKLKLKRTMVFSCEDPPKQHIKDGVWWLHGSGKWMLSPPMLSLYTMLIREGFCHQKGKSFEETYDAICKKTITPKSYYDSNFFLDSKVGINRIIKYGYHTVFYQDIHKNYPLDMSCDSAHAHGIVTFSSNLIHNYNTPVPYWYRKIIKDQANE